MNGYDARLFGYKISRRELDGDVRQALDFVAGPGNGRYMACANPHSLVVASRDLLFQSALQDADILLPDGTGIVLAAKVLDLPIKERVAGFEFFQRVCETLAKRGGGRFFFLGSSDRVLERIETRLRQDYPNITVCGTYSPPFADVLSEVENARIIEAVNGACPDVLWVGMTAPKQEKWIHQNRDKLNVCFIGAIGAVFDFYAGTKNRSSLFWRRRGLEWLPRLIKEPRRLWQRNMKSTPIFLFWVCREKWKQALGK